MLLDLLGDQADLGARVALVVKAVDCLAIKGLTNRLNVLLQTLVREETTRLRGCRRGALRRASAKGDVGRQLKLLVRQRLLLKELVVPGSVFSLPSGLIDLTGSHLSRSARKCCVLSACAKGGKGCGRVCTHTVNALAQGRPLLRCRNALTKLLLAQSGLLCCRSGTLTKLLLAQSGKLARRSGTLTKLLLTQ
jgi:hypothetical protein